MKINNNYTVRTLLFYIPGGTYGIRCFLDQNANSKLDSNLFGPTESWGMSFNQDRPWGMPVSGAICIISYK